MTFEDNIKEKQIADLKKEIESFKQKVKDAIDLVFTSFENTEKTNDMYVMLLKELFGDEK